MSRSCPLFLGFNYLCLHILFSVLILPNKAWHKDIKLVTNTIYSCVNPCKFNLHDTKAEVSVLMSINVRSASTPDLQFCCHDSCCRQRLRKQRRMLNNDEDDEMLPKGKFSHWKKKEKNGEGDGFGWVTPHWQLIGSQTYIATLYTLLATTDSPFPLKITWSPKNNHLPWLKMLNVPQSHLIFEQFCSPNSFLQFLTVRFVLLATQARCRTPMPRY